MHHVNDKGEIKRCRAAKGRCRFAIHGANVKDTELKLAETEGPEHLEGVHREAVVDPTGHILHASVDPNNLIVQTIDNLEEFGTGEGGFYGNLPPRPIQVPALNAVAEALEEGDATQLIAACGTGKTYMHRQLLNQQMSQEDSTGVGIILTSSIRLAHDTAMDLRPTEEGDKGYDKSFGKFGEDYEVIEVHSGATAFEYDGETRPGVVESGSGVSSERIRQQMEAALASGKKVIIVSTYDSVDKVVAAQKTSEDPSLVEADMLIHDEAHNILGQQRPSVVAGEDNELTAYVGFHNAIPGSLQARKRLYSTATPVLQESDGDTDGAKDLEAAIKAASRMTGPKKDQYERVTIYSDHELVGGVSGFISQDEAVEAKCLAKPSYEVRSSTLKGAIKNFEDPVVRADGTLEERKNSSSEWPLTPATYGAINSTLDALASDPAHPKDNVPHNALAYVGSIAQAEAFNASFKEVALARSGGMELKQAQELINSSDEELKMQARYRLLAEHSDVKAAHSTQAKSKREEAFAMFTGHAATDHEWTPHKRVLANVDIFSEGVSIPEIDAVVISDDNKLNEKAMTQAIGRAIRVVPKNEHKVFGRVIIPNVSDEQGVGVTESSVNLATYGATRVERSLAVTKLKGDPIVPDEETSFRVYETPTKASTRLARDFAQTAITDPKELAVATAIGNAHATLRDAEYNKLSQAEKFQLQKSYIADKVASTSPTTATGRYFRDVQSSLAGLSAREVKNMERNGRVLSQAISSGDISSVNPALTVTLIENGILQVPQAKTEATLTTTDKREYLRDFTNEFSFSVLAGPKPPASKKVDAEAHQLRDRAHEIARQRLEAIMKAQGPVKGKHTEALVFMRGKGKATPYTQRLHQAYEQALQDEIFVDAAFAMHDTTMGDDLLPAVFGSSPRTKELKASCSNLFSRLLTRRTETAQSGQVAYARNSAMVKTTGELKREAIIAMLEA